jgi:hypothetical protein
MGVYAERNSTRATSASTSEFGQNVVYQCEWVVCGRSACWPALRRNPEREQTAQAYRRLLDPLAMTAGLIWFGKAQFLVGLAMRLRRWSTVISTLGANCGLAT